MLRSDARDLYVTQKAASEILASQKVAMQSIISLRASARDRCYRADSHMKMLQSEEDKQALAMIIEVQRNTCQALLKNASSFHDCGRKRSRSQWPSPSAKRRRGRALI